MAFFNSWSAADIARAVKAGELSATEVTHAALDTITACDDKTQAFLEVSHDLALQTAARVDKARAQGEELGPLAGVPMAYKDNMHLLGTHTTCASNMLKNYESTFTATCVARTLAADAIPVGKTNMDEFAFGSSTESSAFKKTANPWDVTRVPGGSSGGSAAAVAAGEVPLALGSDTGGSIRQPASFCGVVGLKPTYGAVSRYGVVAFGSSLDQVGPFGRSVEDVALAMNALCADGRDAYDSTSQDLALDFVAGLGTSLKGKRVGIIPALMEVDGLASEVKEALKVAAAIFEAHGATLVEVDLPNLASAISAYYVIAPCEAFSNLARFDGVRYGYQEPNCTTLAQQTALSRAHGFGEEAKRRQLLGAYLLSSGVYDTYYYPAQQVRTLITQDYKRAFCACDVIMMPTAPRTAFKFGEMSDPTQMYAADMFTISNNICGNCGISVPLGLGTDTHLPVSAQLQGPAFADAALLNFAYALEQGVLEHFAQVSAKQACAAHEAGGAAGDPSVLFGWSKNQVAPTFAAKGGEL